MVRIIAGEFRGRKLFTPKDMSVRPTADRVREAVFNILQNEIPDRRVLDLFAGSGAFGLEALSRGARLAAFVDADPAHMELLERNIALLGAEARTKTLRMDFERAILTMAGKGNKFDIVYVDPPYQAGYYEKALELLFTMRILNRDATVVVEHPAELELTIPAGCAVRDKRKYGKTAVTLIQEG